MKKLIPVLGTLLFSVSTFAVESVLLHPPFNLYYMCAEHEGAAKMGLGDAYGTDCFIARHVKKEGRSWMRSYSGDGKENADWFSWRKDVLAPLDSKVVKVTQNEKTNLPGIKGKGIATFVVFAAKDGTVVLMAHLREVTVKKGDMVKRGQVIGKVGNNGQSWHPHVHIGAYRENKPLQIRFDQDKIKNTAFSQ